MSDKTVLAILEYAAYTRQVRDRIEAMSSGNAHAAKGVHGAQERNLSLKRGEYWETRPVPVSAHHFTQREYEAYLTQHRFPANTLSDRMRHHVKMIERALVNGWFVPMEVMKDAAGKEALADAKIVVGAEAEGVWKESQRKEAQRQFERAIGCWTPNGDPKKALRELMVKAAKGELHECAGGMYGWVARGYKRVSMEHYPREVMVSLRSGSGTARWMEVRDSGWNVQSLFGEIYRIDVMDAERTYQEALLNKEVSLEEARSVMGWQWAPFASISALSSVQA